MQFINKDERQPWKTQEDHLIEELVFKYGTKKWTLIANILKERVENSRRNGKQCRERWHNHLDPMVRKSPWNETEDFVFLEAHKIHGNKWADIAKMIPGRTDNSIKNHFYSTLRKLISNIQKDDISLEARYDNQQRHQTLYLLKYLQVLVSKQQQDNLPKTNIAILNEQGLHIGSNDLYIIKKIKESGITVEKLWSHQSRLKNLENKRSDFYLQLQKRNMEINTQKKVPQPVFRVIRKYELLEIEKNSQLKNDTETLMEDESSEMIDQQRMQELVTEQMEESKSALPDELKIKSDQLLREYNESKVKELQLIQQQEQDFRILKNKNNNGIKVKILQKPQDKQQIPTQDQLTPKKDALQSNHSSTVKEYPADTEMSFAQDKLIPPQSQPEKLQIQQPTYQAIVPNLQQQQHYQLTQPQFMFPQALTQIPQGFVQSPYFNQFQAPISIQCPPNNQMGIPTSYILLPTQNNMHTSSPSFDNMNFQPQIHYMPQFQNKMPVYIQPAQIMNSPFGGQQVIFNGPQFGNQVNFQQQVGRQPLIQVQNQSQIHNMSVDAIKSKISSLQQLVDTLDSIQQPSNKAHPQIFVPDNKGQKNSHQNQEQIRPLQYMINHPQYTTAPQNLNYQVSYVNQQNVLETSTSDQREEQKNISTNNTQDLVQGISLSHVKYIDVEKITQNEVTIIQPKNLTENKTSDQNLGSTSKQE